MSHIGNMRYRSSPAWSMGNSMRGRALTSAHSPGPGAYQSKDIKSKQISIQFGRDKRSDLALKNNAPGPGQYDHRKYIGQAPAFTMIPRRKNAQGIGKDGPGPGSYEYFNKTLPDRPKFTFGLKTAKDQTINVFDKNVPGPGSYTIKEDLIRNKIGAKFGNSQRDSINSSPENPGPGNYKFKQYIGQGPK